MNQSTTRCIHSVVHTSSEHGSHTMGAYGVCRTLTIDQVRAIIASLEGPCFWQADSLRLAQPVFGQQPRQNARMVNRRLSYRLARATPPPCCTLQLAETRLHGV